MCKSIKGMTTCGKTGDAYLKVLIDCPHFSPKFILCYSDRTDHHHSSRCPLRLKLRHPNSIMIIVVAFFLALWMKRSTFIMYLEKKKIIACLLANLLNHYDACWCTQMVSIFVGTTYQHVLCVHFYTSIINYYGISVVLLNLNPSLACNIYLHFFVIVWPEIPEGDWYASTLLTSCPFICWGVAILYSNNYYLCGLGTFSILWRLMK